MLKGVNKLYKNFNSRPSVRSDWRRKRDLVFKGISIHAPQ